MGEGMFSGGTNASTLRGANVFGILYAEDFDNPSELDADGSDAPANATVQPSISQADVDAACAEAVLAARARWTNENEHIRMKMLASLASAVAGIRDANTKTASDVAEATVMTILSIVTGLLPHFAREFGAKEVRALLGRLLPTIRSKTRINVRVHADLVNLLQDDLAGLEPDQAAMIDVTAAPLEQGDVKVSWENGSLTRDTRQIIQAIQDALGELGLQQPVEAPSKKRMAYAD